jgi:hypothetical protein
MSGWFLPSKNCRGSEAIRQAAQPENPNCRLYDQNFITGLFSKLSFFHFFTNSISIFYFSDFHFFIFVLPSSVLCFSYLHACFQIHSPMDRKQSEKKPETGIAVFGF